MGQRVVASIVGWNALNGYRYLMVARVSTFRLSLIA